MAEQQRGGNPPPGWYQDPQGGGRRYWDGQQWTDHVEPASAPEAPTTPPPPPGPQPGAAPEPPAPQAGRPAGAGIRFGARIIDGLLLGIPYSLILAAIGVGVAGSTGESFLFGLLGSAIYLGYFVYMESSRGQTLGKQVLNLRTVGPGGANPTQQQAFTRNAWVLVGIIPFLGGLASLAIAVWIAVTISNDPQGRGVHDNWGGGTTVVRAG